MTKKTRSKTHVGTVHNTLSSAVPDNTVDFPIVGIGASAGGLAAFEAFFSGMPTDVDPGMAFVVVQHLAPDHKSILTELIRRYTRMEVFEVEDGMKIQPNCTYIIPPNYDMALLKGKLMLMEPSMPRGLRLPIDFFFRSLAQDQQERAIGIILSGTASDGTQGVQAIKNAGGMVIAQDPGSADFDGMPLSAINTGLVDYILPPAQMPKQLIDYVDSALGSTALTPPELTLNDETALQKIFILLRAQTNHDFSEYKPSTIYRRIERRMAIHQIKTIDAYVTYLQESPEEMHLLFMNLLIGVTGFFRDPKAFAYLYEQIVPRLFAQRTPDIPIRIWVTACSTGEEVYSLAILLWEYMEQTKQRVPVQIFASDINTQAIASARTGLYASNILADVSTERLARFFTAESHGNNYRIHKNIRDMVVFSEHNVIKDPPFSRLDLISCRNLMIYMNTQLQRKLLETFHYALNPQGILFLGTSETVGSHDDLFTMLDQKAKVYQRKHTVNKEYRMTLMHPFPRVLTMPSFQTEVTKKLERSLKLPLRELTEQAILQHAVADAALVDSSGDILYLHGQAGKYLEIPSGVSAVNNILKMAQKDLSEYLATGIQKAIASNKRVDYDGIRVKTDGGESIVKVTFYPLKSNAAATLQESLYLIVFETSPLDDAEEPRHRPEGNSDQHIAALKHELHLQDQFLQDANEKLARSNEELKSYNEEIQSMNEELQSTNEELETSKEELQSVNEELSTVNSELQTKVSDLSHANDDMNNLLAGTGIGTVFVDYRLNIMRFTPTITKIINLIPSDIGRPVGHIVSNLVDYNQLETDIQCVLDSLISKSLEVKTKEGNSYLMHIGPYRTLENVIEGAVITFVNISQIVQIREALKRANALTPLAKALWDASDAIIIHDLQGAILAWNPAAEARYGWSEAEALKMNLKESVPPSLRETILADLRKLGTHPNGRPYCTQRMTKKGAVLDISLTAATLHDASGKVYAVATTERLRDPSANQSLEA